MVRIRSLGEVDMTDKSEACLYKSQKGEVVTYTPAPYREATITWEQFRELIIKAQSRTEKAPAEVMKFLDIIIHGEPLQDYENIDIYQRLSNVSIEPRNTTNPGSDN